MKFNKFLAVSMHFKVKNLLRKSGTENIYSLLEKILTGHWLVELRIILSFFKCPKSVFRSTFFRSIKSRQKQREFKNCNLSFLTLSWCICLRFPKLFHGFLL